MRPVRGVDGGIVRVDPMNVALGPTPRDRLTTAIRLGRQFVELNRPLAGLLDATIDMRVGDSETAVIFELGSTAGAVPLVSPVTGRVVSGLLVEPRFGWPGIGALMSEMGLTTVPTLLPVSLVPSSARQLPPWLISAVVLDRVAALLNGLSRRFVMRQAAVAAPRGSIDWGAYVSAQLSRGAPASVPCRFPDLTQDLRLRGGIHFALLKEVASLEAVRHHGEYVLRLLGRARTLVNAVSDAPAVVPTAREFEAWLRADMGGQAMRDGLSAVQWVLDDRGLAGPDALGGLAWRLPLAELFEGWLEVVVRCLQRRIGGTVRTGRELGSLVPLRWDPPYRGTQKYLLPDVVIETAEATIVFDAKYKGHWQAFHSGPWARAGEDVRDAHREDLLQALAYAAGQSAKRVICVLVYPVLLATWRDMAARGDAAYRASVVSGDRSVDLVLTGLPFAESADQAAAKLGQVLGSQWPTTA